MTSRAADNLFWMGRYTERVENSVATVQLVLNLLSGEERASPALLHWLDGLLRDQGLLPESAAPLLADDPAGCLRSLIDEVLDLVAARWGDEVRATTADGRPALDVAAGVRRALAEAGVTTIVPGEHCTAERADLYWSHRARAETGRFATVAWLEP